MKTKLEKLGDGREKRSAYSSSIMISKEQVNAPVGHTASQVVHQWQSSVSIIVIFSSIKTIAPQVQTLTQSPH
jgi:hypothetical protein